MGYLWSQIFNASSCEQKFQLFMSKLNEAIDMSLPYRVIRKHPTDRPWITNKIKLSISKRQSAFLQHGKDSKEYRYWRNKVQSAIRSAKCLYYQKKVAEAENVNSAKWWRDIKKLSGQDAKQDWHHQFLDNNMNIKSLANQINTYFVGLTAHFTPLRQGAPPLYVPDEFLISEYEAYRSMSSLQVSKAVGPDNIPNRVLKDFALELAPLIKDIHNQSLREGYMPSLLKSSIVSPIPKISPPASIEKDLRPISLTCTIAKLMESFVCNRLMPQLHNKIDPRQYSLKGHSTTDALLYMLQAIYEAVDSGEACARIFFADFSKGFDSIDHTILMRELAQLNVHPALLSWIAAFLTNRKQAVRIGGTLSDWLPLKGGVPQGTKLGVILFTVMTNKFLSDWRLHIKYVDDTSVLEIIPRNSISLLNTVASDIHQFAKSHNMRLNPAKCKEMRINFLHNNNCLINPIILGADVIECVNTYKILGVIMDKDLKWNSHVEHITKKACKKLYALRVLRRAGVSQANILKIYLSTVRPVLEYAVPVWQAIPDYLSVTIEQIQRRALYIIYPEAESYTHALQLAQLDRLEIRRDCLCTKYMNQMKSPQHPIHHLLPRPAPASKYNLRRNSPKFYLYNSVSQCRTKRSTNFFTFRYFN